MSLTPYRRKSLKDKHRELEELTNTQLKGKIKELKEINKDTTTEKNKVEKKTKRTK